MKTEAQVVMVWSCRNDDWFIEQVQVMNLKQLVQKCWIKEDWHPVAPRGRGATPCTAVEYPEVLHRENRARGKYRKLPKTNCFQSEGNVATEILLLKIKNSGYAMTSRVSYNTLGWSKSNPGDLFSYNFANLSIIWSSTVNFTSRILVCPDLSVILDGRGSKSLPSPSFHLKSLIFTVFFFFSIDILPELFQISLHSRDILSCSCCSSLSM